MIIQIQPLECIISLTEFYLWVIHVLITFLLGSFTLARYLRIDKTHHSKLEKRNVISWILFFLLFGIANILNIVSRFIVQDDDLALILDSFSYYPIYLSWLSKLLPLENALREYEIIDTRYIFSIMIVFLILFSIIINPLNYVESGFNPLLVMHLILYNFGIAFLPGCFLYFALKSEGDQRKDLLMALLGTLLVLIGMTFQPSSTSIVLNDTKIIEFLSVLGPVLILGGLIMIFLSYKKSIRKEKN